MRIFFIEVSPLKTLNFENVINISNIYKVYLRGKNKIYALNNVSLSIKKGEFVTIVGQSGSGKSTLMNIIGCLDSPTKGHCYILNQDVFLLKDHALSKLRNQTIGFIFQGFNLIPSLNAVENVELPLSYGRINKKIRRKKAIECLEKVGLGNRLDHYPREMSGGQQQRVAIARAIAVDPSIILADEPTGNLDSKAGAEVLQILTNLNELGSTVILITHDDSIALRAKRIVKISDGKILSDSNFI